MAVHAKRLDFFHGSVFFFVSLLGGSICSAGKALDLVADGLEELVWREGLAVAVIVCRHFVDGGRREADSS